MKCEYCGIYTMLDNRVNDIGGSCFGADGGSNYNAGQQWEKGRAEFMGVFEGGITELLHVGRPMFTASYKICSMPI
jgi:hypothetical protein